MAQVEGTWKNFTFKFIDPEDIPKVYEHLRASFYHDERISQLSGYSNDYAEDLERLYDAIFCMGERLSFIAIDNTNGKVAGVRITYTHKKYTSFDHLKDKFKSQQMLNLMTIIHHCNEEANVFGRYPIDHYAFYITASILREYRNQGLASEMYRRSEALLRQHKFPLVASCFTSPWTRKIAANRNFVEPSRFYMKDLKGKDGKELLPNAQDDDFAATMVLKMD